MGAKALEVASLARGTSHRRSLRPFSRPSERFLDRGSRGFGAERFLSSGQECLIDLNSGSPRHLYIIQNDCVHTPVLGTPMTPGSYVRIRRGVPHTFVIEGDSNAQYLILYAPGAVLRRTESSRRRRRPATTRTDGFRVVGTG